MIYVAIVVTNKLNRNGSTTAFHDSMSVDERFGFILNIYFSKKNPKNSDADARGNESQFIFFTA
jgi:hypothetical protein